MTVAVSLLALSVVWCAVCALNKMTKNTRFMVRLAYILLGSGAMAAAMQPWWMDYEYSAAEVLLIVALAVFVLADNRGRRHAI